ncbi:MAG: porin [Pseudomonadota bacterium]|nr:porin [Pseudomonadota bacterium]
MTSCPTVLALSILLGFAAVPAQAQTIDEMRVELKQLRAEIDLLKGRKAVEVTPPAAAGVPDPRVAPRIEAAASAPESAIAGGMLVPGTSTSLLLYGYGETHAIHDFKQSNTPDVFTDLANQPLNSAGGQTGKTQFTAETSRLGFRSSTPGPKGPLTTKIEIDFYAYGADNRNLLRLRHAYGEYDGWLIGQTWSTFMDVDDLPETVDFNGPIGAPFSRRAQVRYAFGDAKAGVRVTLAAEDPADLAGGPSSGEKVPQLVARLDKTFEYGAFNLRTMTHTKRSPTETRRGYGFGVGGSLKLGSKDTLMAQYAQVNGDVDALYGSNGYAIADTHSDNSGDITFDRNQGLVLGHAHVFSDRLRSNVALGFNRGKTDLGNGNRTLRQLFANLIYTPIQNVDLGAEWIWGERKTFADQAGGLSRIDLMARYSF